MIGLGCTRGSSLKILNTGSEVICRPTFVNPGVTYAQTITVGWLTSKQAWVWH